MNISPFWPIFSADRAQVRKCVDPTGSELGSRPKVIHLSTSSVGSGVKKYNRQCLGLVKFNISGPGTKNSGSDELYLYYSQK